MDRVTKLIVVGWACTALAAEIWLSGSAWLRLFALSAFTPVLLETWVSRVIRPRDIGVADDRELGLLVRWEFLDVLPAGVTSPEP
jgi:hypothetical protein